MDSSANKQWLAELEKDDGLGELELIDPLSMQQLAESLANELWSQRQPPHQEQQPTTGTGFSFVGGSAAAPGVGRNNILMSFFTDDGSSSSTTVGTAGNNCCCPPLTTPLAEKKAEGTGSGRRARSSVKEHVLAERKRREKMHHQFATLASIVPDITKTDKVSVLGSTIEYVHHLKDRLKTLQKERRHFAGSGSSSTADSESLPPSSEAQCCTAGTGTMDETVHRSDESPKIEVDVRGKTILLRVVCREKKGVLIVLLTELENRGLSIINTNVVPFAESSLNITITAQIEDRTSSTGELVNSLTSALNKVC